MKKLLSLLLAVMMVITMLPVAAFADELELFATGEQIVDPVEPFATSEADTRTVTYTGGSVEAVKVGTCEGKKVYLAELPEGATGISAGLMDIAIYPTGADNNENLWIKNEQFNEYIASCGITIDEGAIVSTRNVKGYIAQVYFVEDGNQWIIYQLPCEEESNPEPALSDLKITYNFNSTYKDENALTLYPEFDSDTKDYSVIASDAISSVYLWAYFDENYPSATATATYINAGNGTEKNVTLYNGSSTSLTQLISSSTVGEKVITITVHTNPNSEDDRVETYTVTVCMAPALSGIKLSWGDYSKNVSFSKMKYNGYEAFVPSNTGITVEATAYNANSKIEILGAVDGVVTPVWSNNSSTLQIDVRCDGDSYSSRYAVELYEMPDLYVAKAPDKTEYEVGEKIDLTGMEVKAVYSDREELIDLSSEDVTITPSATAIINDSVDKITVTYKDATAEYPITVKSYEFKGEGTKENPYLLENADDCVGLSKEVSAGKSFKDTYFKITDNITLPEGWVPIGGPKEGQTFVPNLHGRNFNYFSGHIDGANPKGGNFLLTIPKGGKTLLGCVVGGGSLSNLDIYGERINGYGVMEYYVVSPVYPSDCMDITNVNLKSGTHTKMSGFLGGYASGSNNVDILNCTIEEGVVIGDDGSWGDELSQTYSYNFVETVQYNDMVGSFGGGFSGTIRNCVSYATVYGRNYVGGIVGFKGQSMGSCDIENTEFAGKVIATGNYVGGIIGSGYSASSAPNTPCVVIQNCLVSGSVTGADKVGGVFGGNANVKSCWNNGIGYIRANLVTGSVTATAENATVGAIIGHINAVNAYNIIKNNYYTEGISVKGIGKITTVNTDNIYCDTQEISAADLTNGKAVELLNSAKAGVTPWKQGAVGPVFSDNNRIYGIKLSKLNSMSPQRFYSSKGYNSFVTSGGNLTAKYKDGSSVTVLVIDGVTNGPDFSVSGVQLCSVIYDGYEHFFGINVISDGDPADQQMKSVKIKVFGDTVHEVTADKVHTLDNGNLTEWLGETAIMVPNEASALDVVEKAVKAYGMSCVINDSAYGKYLVSMTKNGVTLDDSCNKQSDGKAYCGWQFNVNGNPVYTSLDQTVVSEGDIITVYFEDDYSLAYVQTAIDAIKAIPEETADDYDEKVDAAEASLKYLSPLALAKVKADPSFAKLEEARYKRGAKPVIDLIDAIGTVEYTDDCKAKIDAARKAYDALSKNEQKYVSNYQTLVDAEKDYADRDAAAKVEDLINSIGAVTKDSGDAIKAAREAYDELNDEQKKFVSDEAVAALVKAEKLFDMITNSNKPDASDKSDGTGSIIHISSNAAAKGEENPNTGAEAMSIAPAVLMLGAAMLIFNKRR